MLAFFITAFAAAISINSKPVKLSVISPPSDPEALEESAMPSWRQGQKVGEWRQISNTAMSSIEPNPVPAGNTGPSSKVGAWTSFVVDPRDSTVYSLANGGHNDYSGNEVDRLELESSPAKWVKRILPTPAGEVNKNEPYNDDKRPASRHSYYGVVFDPIQKIFLLFGGAIWHENGGGSKVVDSYNIATNSWNLPGSHPSAPDLVMSYAGAPFVADPSTGNVYAFGNYAIYKFSGNRWSLVNSSGVWAYSAMNAIDTKRGQILLLAGQVGEKSAYKISTNTLQTIALTGAAKDEATTSGGGPTESASMIYVKAVDKYFIREADAGSKVYQVTPQNVDTPASFDIVTMPNITGGSGIPRTENGPFNKFLYVPRLKGAVYVPEYYTSAWFIRLF